MRKLPAEYRAAWSIGLPVALVALGGCRPQPIVVSPETLARVDMETVREWVAELAPPSATRYDLRWTFQTQRGAVRGQAALRVEPPDSLRFDYRGPFGRSGAAFLVDRDLIWAVPEGEVERLFQIVPLFWAALGLPRDPPSGTRIFGSEAEDGRRWRYGVGRDTLEYYVARTPHLRFLAVMRQLDAVLGHVEVNFDEQTHLPTKATLTFPETASVLILDVASIDTSVALSENVWKRP